MHAPEQSNQASQTPAQPVAKLPQVISHLLQQSGVTEPYAWSAGIHPDAMHDEPQIQQFQCSRHWTVLLAASQDDTRFARYCLTSAHSVKVWLQAFQTLVIPMYLKILQNQNPQSVNIPQPAVQDQHEAAFARAGEAVQQRGQTSSILHVDDASHQSV